jgi:prepilin-type N-terminal cleavage/methylation domain-containing protein
MKSKHIDGFALILHKKQRGFTIVELLIVIVVIGILAAIVITSFAGVQAKARDSKRQADVSTLAKQLEVDYANDGVYPSTQRFLSNNSTATVITPTQALAETWAVANLKGIDVTGLRAPGKDGSFNTLIPATNATITTAGVTPQPTKDTYVYQPLTSTNTLCTPGNVDCAKFNIYYMKEQDSSVQQKSSVN